MVALLSQTSPRTASTAAQPGKPPPPGRALRWMTISLLLAVVPTFLNLPLWAPLFFLACAAWRWRIEWRRGAIPGKWVLAALFSAACILIVAVQRLDGSTAALTFLLVLVSLKLLELDTRRDYIVAALLGYFLVLSGFFFNQSLLLALYTALALVVNTLALTMACGASPVRPSLRLSLALCLQTLPIVTVLFIFFPRIDGQFQLFSGRGRVGQAGMSDRLSPGQFARIAESDDVAFRAELPAEPVVQPGNLYWRGPVLAQCDGLAWSAVVLPIDATPAAETAVPDVNRPAVAQRITLEPQQNRWLFALDLPVESATKDVIFAANGSRSIEYRQPVMRKLVYNVTSRLPAAGALIVAEPKQPNVRYLQLPRTLSPKVRALAEGWRRNAKRGDVEIVGAGLEFFRSGGFAYTLSPGTYVGADPLEEFLFERRRGFCEHFAASFATLMRAAGVPARLVLGYQGGRLNWLGSHLTILQSDAHSWCEVWLAGRGWHRVDPTAVVAPDRVNLGADSYNALAQMGQLSATERLQQLFRLNNPTGFRWLARNFSMAWDTIDMQWNLHVVGFNLEAQGDLMRDLGLGRLGIFGGAMGIVLGLGIGAGAFAFFLFLRSRSLSSSHGQASVLAKIYARFCRKIARAGGPLREPHEGPLDFAQRAAGVLPASAGEIQRITQIYVDGRYRRGFGEIEAGAGELLEAVRAFRPRREHDTEKNLVSSTPIRG